MGGIGSGFQLVSLMTLEMIAGRPSREHGLACALSKGCSRGRVKAMEEEFAKAIPGSRKRCALNGSKGQRIVMTMRDR